MSGVDHPPDWNDIEQSVIEKLAAHRETWEFLAETDVPLSQDAQAIIEHLERHEEP